MEKAYKSLAAAPAEVIVPEELSVSTFCEQYGDKSGFDDRTIRLIWSDAAAQYRPLPFHNFQHTTETLWEAMRLADICETLDTPCDTRALVVATLFHDAGYHKSIDEHGYKTKEAYSAVILGQHSAKYDLTPVETITAMQAIEATTVGTRIKTVEDKIMVRADIHNIGLDDKSHFIQKTDLLREEAKLFSGWNNQQFSESNFIKNNILTLATYLANDLSFGKNDQKWLQNAAANVNGLIATAAQQEDMHQSRYVRLFGNTAVNRLFSQSNT